MLKQFLSFLYFSNSRAAAEAAKPLLTKKLYGVQYNFNKLFETSIPEYGIKNVDIVMLMGYTDSYIPQMFRFSSNSNLKGKYETSWSAAGNINSVKELIHVLKLQTQEYRDLIKKQSQNFDQQKQNQWSSQNIASLLDLEATEREQLESSVIAGFNAPMGIVSFDNRTIEQLIKGKFSRRWNIH